MSAAQVAKLEALLQRVQSQRGAPRKASVAIAAAPTAPSDPVAAAPPRTATEVEEAIVSQTPTPPDPIAARGAENFDLLASSMPPAMTNAEAELEDDKPRGVQPTPMERALEFELETKERPETSVELEITFDDPSAGDDADYAGDEEEEDEVEEVAPTAPVATQAPRTEPAPLRTDTVTAPRAIPIAAPIASTPIARAVSRIEAPAPRTFAELLGRTLALRPRRDRTSERSPG